MKGAKKMIKDDKLSILLQEAKPLYFAQKKKRKAITQSLASLVMILGLSYYAFPNSSPYIYDLDGLEEEIYLTQNGSCIETYDLPIDEYGFLEVV